MTIEIVDKEVVAMVKRLAELTGQSEADALRQALVEKLAKEGSSAADDKQRRYERLMEIGRKFAALPVLDDRSADEIIGYDEHGLPK